VSYTAETNWSGVLRSMLKKLFGNALLNTNSL